VAASLRAAQRVFRLALGYNQTRTLLAGGMHSAGAVLAPGPRPVRPGGRAQRHVPYTVT